MRNDFLVTNTKGRAPAELIGTNESDFLPGEWVVHAPAAHGASTVQTSGGAAFGSALTELDPGLRRVLDGRGANRMRPQGTVRSTDSAPGGMALIPCYTLDPHDTVSPTWVPASATSGTAGGPTFRLDVAGFQLATAKKLAAPARANDLLWTICVRGGNSTARPTMAGFLIDLLPGEGAVGYCEIEDTDLKWCEDFGLFEDATAMNEALADETRFVSPVRVTYGSDADGGYADLSRQPIDEFFYYGAGSFRTPELESGAEWELRARINATLTSGTLWFPMTLTAVTGFAGAFGMMLVFKNTGGAWEVGVQDTADDGQVLVPLAAGTPLALSGEWVDLAFQLRSGGAGAEFNVLCALEGEELESVTGGWVDASASVAWPAAEVPVQGAVAQYDASPNGENRLYVRGAQLYTRA